MNRFGNFDFSIKKEFAQVQDVSVTKNKETRKDQTCSLCQNHNVDKLKKGHKCDFDTEEHIKFCGACRMTKDRRFAASKDKKNNYRKRKNFGSALKTKPSFGKTRNEQLCRKCANHGDEVSMKNHKNDCKRMNCSCIDCIETEIRRKAVKQEAKAKRQKSKNQMKQENDQSMSSPCPSSPNESGYNSDLSASYSPNHSSYCSVSQVDSKFSEPIPFLEPINFDYQEEKKYSWEMNPLTNIQTTDYYTSNSSNIFQEIVSFPVKTETNETFIQDFVNLTMNEDLIQNIVQGLINNEFDIEEVFDLYDSSNYL